MYSCELSFVATTRVEAGAGFGIGRQSGPIVLEVRTHHDTIPVRQGVQVGFELLRGITAEQTKKILDVLNENVIDVLVTMLLDWTKRQSLHTDEVNTRP